MKSEWIRSVCVSGGLIISVLLSCSDGFAGKLEDLLLENKQITVDQWVQLKAEEEQRQAKAFEESRGVGDVPVRERPCGAPWPDRRIPPRELRRRNGPGPGRGPGRRCSAHLRPAPRVGMAAAVPRDRKSVV